MLDLCWYRLILAVHAVCDIGFKVSLWLISVAYRPDGEDIVPQILDPQKCNYLGVKVISHKDPPQIATSPLW